MDKTRAEELLRAESERLDALEASLRQERNEAVAGREQEGDSSEDSTELVGELLDAAALQELVTGRRQALIEAERRLKEGSYGRSIKSGAVIPDERLEADPLATMTAEEAEEEGGLERLSE